MLMGRVFDLKPNMVEIVSRCDAGLDKLGETDLEAGGHPEIQNAGHL
jgi:hypothetical protein